MDTVDQRYVEMAKKMSTEERRRYVSQILSLFLPNMSWDWSLILHSKTPMLEEDYSGRKFAEFITGLYSLVEIEHSEDILKSCFFMDEAIKYLGKYGIDITPIEEMKETYCTPTVEDANSEEQ